MLQTEELLTLAEAANRLPRNAGRPISPSTIWRWARYGFRDASGVIVRLETRCIGRRMYTSIEALERFTRRLAEAWQCDAAGLADDDPDDARLQPFAEVAARIPVIDGQRIDAKRLFRWFRHGARVTPEGRIVYLRARKVGTSYQTSLAAVWRFVRELAEESRTQTRAEFQSSR